MHASCWLWHESSEPLSLHESNRGWQVPPGHALAAPGTSLVELRARDRAAKLAGLTLGGQPIGSH